MPEIAFILKKDDFRFGSIRKVLAFRHREGRRRGARPRRAMTSFPTPRDVRASAKSRARVCCFYDRPGRLISTGVFNCLGLRVADCVIWAFLSDRGEMWRFFILVVIALRNRDAINRMRV